MSLQFLIFGYLTIWIFKLSDTWIVGYLIFLVSGYLDSKNGLDIQVFGYLSIQITRHKYPDIPSLLTVQNDRYRVLNIIVVDLLIVDFVVSGYLDSKMVWIPKYPDTQVLDIRISRLYLQCTTIGTESST